MNKPICILPYSPDRKNDWDSFVEGSKNGTFLFKRDYMEYHADRFDDCSFLFLKENKIVALIPGCVKGELFTSHAGLTYGGFVLSSDNKVVDVLEYMRLLIDQLKEMKIKKVLYKCVPHIYHRLPAEEDLYALFRVHAKLVRRDIATTVVPHLLPYGELRKRKIKQALKGSVTIRNGTNWKLFWDIVVRNLDEKYGVQPTHSLSEIQTLHESFPHNIHFYEAIKEGTTIGGIVVYVTESCVHVQYPHASPEGKASGAIDLLVNHLLNEVYPNIPYFDFGISTEANGTFLNESLIFMKEGFGGRAIAYDQYEIDLTRDDLFN